MHGVVGGDAAVVERESGRAAGDGDGLAWGQADRDDLSGAERAAAGRGGDVR